MTKDNLKLSPEQSPGANPGLYSFSDSESFQSNLEQRLLEYFKSAPAIEDDNYKLQLADIKVIPAPMDPQSERNAILSGQTLANIVKARFQLIDKKTNQVVSEAAKRLAQIPRMTPRGTFILNGVEYGYVNQLRLRPGIYTRLTDAGEYEAMVNTANVPGHRIVLDPQTARFSIAIRQANIPLVPVLRALGFSDDELIGIMGKELFIKNSDAGRSANLARVAALLGEKGESPEQAIRNYFSKIAFDPRVTQITLGLSSRGMDKETITAVLNKLIRAARGEDTIDDRNHLAFVRLMTPDSMLMEAVARNYQPMLRKYFNRVRARRDLKYLPTGFLDQPVEAAIYGSGLGSVLQEINPVEIVDTRYRITRLGPGGIPSHEQISDELRYTHPSFLNFIDPIVTAEGESVGVDSRFASGVRWDADGNIYSTFIDRRTGKQVQLTPFDLFNKVVTFPGELESGRPYVRAVVNNQHVVVSPRDVDYVVPRPDSIYTIASNLIPMKRSTYPHRISMGSRMITQAVPLLEAESPLVRNFSTEHNKSYDEVLADSLVWRAPEDGVVVEVTPERVVLRSTKTGELKTINLYHDFPYNRKTFYDERPVVKVGQEVKQGDIVARSNYVDEHNSLALGKNLKTAYMAWEGYNFEDAAVISESAAKKLASIHAYQSWFDKFEGTVHDKARFAAMFPGLHERKVYERYDEHGVIKPGEVLQKNDPIMLVAAPAVGLGRRLYKDISPVWEHDDPGVVVAAYNGPKHVNVLIKTVHPLKTGDKISGRYGDKHIIGAIIPDEQMPKDEKGEPFELLLNPLGVQGRVNISQLYELFLAKAAKAKGQPIVVDEYAHPDLREYVQRQLEEAGLKDREKVWLDGYRKAVEVPTGYRYVLKLHHMAESKLGGRGTGEYSMEGTPVKGGAGGAKRIGLLEMLGILAHGAYNVARDARVVRGQKNEDFWTRFKLGFDLPRLIERPMVYDKFLAQLTAMGLYPYQRDAQLHVFALTNKDINDLTKGRELRAGETIEVKDGKIVPIRGGLFDPEITGGLQGTFWSYISLPEPFPNPLIEPHLRALLNVSEDKFQKLITGEERLPNQPAGVEGIINYLKSLNLPRLRDELKGQLEGVRGEKAEAILKRLRFVEALLERGIHPTELFWDRVPVLPPIYRPAGLMQTTGVPILADANLLYKNLLELTDVAKRLQAFGLYGGQERKLIYDAIKAVVGLGDPVHPKYRAQGVKGVLKSVIGSSPKEGVVQKKLLGAQVDLVGRATIIPNPNLNLDEVAIPEKAAWEIYTPFIIRGLIRRGMDARQAVEAVEEKADIARRLLMEEMSQRPVIISRAPVLHKYGVMAAWPKLSTRDVMEIHPFLVTGFGADFDGDAMQFHVPVDPEAVKEAIDKLLPSKNLISFRRFEAAMLPTMEYLAGLYYLSSLKPQGAPVVVRTRRELYERLRSGELDPHQRVVLLEEDERR